MDDPTDTPGGDYLGAVRHVAGLEAAELGSRLIDVEHLVAAAIRPELGGEAVLTGAGLSARRIRDFIMFISGVNEARTALQHGRHPERTSKMRADHIAVTELSAEARRAIDDAGAEAARAGQRPNAVHLLVCCAPLLVSFGATANDLRRLNGLSAPAATRRQAGPAARPRGVGPLILGGGGDLVAPSVLAGLGSKPAAVFIGAADPDRPGPDAWAGAWGRHLDVVDSGLYRPPDASDPEVVDRIAGAGLVLISGGSPRSLFDTLAAGPALDALIEASDNAAVVATTSASAHLLGSAAIDYGPDGFETVPTLGWLPGITVSTHHRNTDEELDNLRRWLWPRLDGQTVLLVPESGAVRVDPGWSTFTTIADGPHGTRACWWSAPDGPLRPLADG